jgi:hypothetical protein
MKNFEHECNGKVANASLESQSKCDNCNCDEGDITDTPCECSCHGN